MPRQPLLRITSINSVYPTFGIDVIKKRPALGLIIAECLTGWSYVEAEMAVLLGALLKAENPGMLAVFQTLRRSSAQRDAISEAGKVTLDSTDQELLSAILDVHKSIESDRNALAHGHIGTSDKITTGLLWMGTSDYVNFRVEISGTRGYSFSPDHYAEFLSMVSVYRQEDLEQLSKDIRDLWHIWFEFTNYHHTPKIAAEKRDQQYRQLCDRPRIGQALMTLRQKNSPSTPPQSPPRVGDGTA